MKIKHYENEHLYPAFTIVFAFIYMLPVIVGIVCISTLLHKVPVAEHEAELVQPVDTTPVVVQAVQQEEEPEETMSEADLLILDDCMTNYDMLCRLCIAEAGNLGYDGMWRVAYVIYCRAYDTNYNFGDNIYEVMTAPNQFTTPYEGDISPWKEDVERAVGDVFIEHNYPFDVPAHYFVDPALISSKTHEWFDKLTYVDTYHNQEYRSNYSAAELEVRRYAVD